MDGPFPRVLIVDDHEVLSRALAVALGQDGFNRDAATGRTVLEPAAREDLLSALREKRSEESARRTAFARLTPRESQVLGLLVEGRGAEEIALKNVVALATVRSQIRLILQKLG